MRIPGVKTARALSRWVQARIFGGALILGYHRVATVKHNEYEVCVTPEHFTEHMKAVSKYAHPIPLSKLVRHLKDGCLPPKSIAVTFDDGYADNLYQAKPILEKYTVPATVFVCTGYAGREFWWDELERLVMSSQTDLGMLCLQLRKNRFISEQRPASSEALVVRKQFCHVLYNFLITVNIDEQNDVMNTVRAWAALPPSESLAGRAMNSQELIQLAEGGLIELGSHTRNHPMLSNLSIEGQKNEIESGKKDLEEIAGKRILGFAYPNGKSTLVAKEIIQESGFEYACTSLHNVVRPGSNMYELTRFWQRDVDGDQFLHELTLWMRK